MVKPERTTITGITSGRGAHKILTMLRNGDVSILFCRFCLILPLMAVLSLHGCATVTRTVPEKPRAVPLIPEETIERNNFLLAKQGDVIGQPAVVTLGKGDTLPDIARHFSLGIDEIGAANPGVDVWVPEPGAHITLPLSHILPDCPRRGIVINLAAMRLFQFRGGSGPPGVSTYPVGIGSTERPSPVGPMHVQRKTVRPTWYVPASIAEDHRKKGDPLPARVPPGPENPLGEYALYLSRPGYLIHGTNKPSSIGLDATNGCIRLYPEDIRKLYASTPVGTPVRIVNQPYLVGRRDGVVYVEAYAPPGGSDAGELEKMYVKLRDIQKKSAGTLDWTKVARTVAEARGVPVPVSAMDQGGGKETADVAEVTHPDRLYGRPEIPELKADAWYVSAADLHDRINAERLAAIINHQGPQIPARVLSKTAGYCVIAGPFNDVTEARDAVKRLKIDLEIEGILVRPARNILK